MTGEEIPGIVEDLDTAVTRDDAKLIIHPLQCDDSDGVVCEFIGNREGYLRLGIEMLKAAMVPLEANAVFTPINIDYMLRSG